MVHYTSPNRVVYHKVDLANFADELQSNQYDLSIGATFATPQRATAVAFTRPAYEITQPYFRLKLWKNIGFVLKVIIETR